MIGRGIEQKLLFDKVALGEETPSVEVFRILQSSKFKVQEEDIESQRRC